VPRLRKLRRQLREIEDFVARCKAGDEDTLFCLGLNFPTTMPPHLRGKLLHRHRAWIEWAISLHTGKRLQEAPTELRLLLGAIRIGDVGIVGMPCEPFSGIGRQIKNGTDLPLAIPCGYMNGSIGYVPDAANTGDTEYMSTFWRMLSHSMPYRKPAGDNLAETGLGMLEKITPR
jgi:hypothetical protein